MTLPSTQVLVDIYRRMTRIRQNDDRIRAAMRAGRLVMPYYSGRGQECIPAGVSAALKEGDYICTIYRGIHDMLAQDVALKILWAELAGKSTGACKGKGGPMHITHAASGVMITTGIVGSTLPIANGLAMSSQIKKDGKATIAYFGDGASNIGAFHEALNLASVWKLPVVFVCQNNRYAEHTKFEVCTAADSVAQRAAAYNMPGKRVDGNDPVDVYDAATAAIERARKGEGPTLLDCLTFRFLGHNIGDDDSYMDKTWKASMVAKDPFPRYRQWLLDTSVATDAQLKDIEAAIDNEIDEAVEFANSSAFPDVAELRRDVYEEELPA
jgi:TPP-dependent pyruvate/acetoin dehydrogenase alpha subunit